MAEDKCPKCGGEKCAKCGAALTGKKFLHAAGVRGVTVDATHDIDGAECLERQRDALEAENALLKGAIRSSETFGDGFCIFCGEHTDSMTHSKCLLAGDGS